MNTDNSESPTIHKRGSVVPLLKPAPNKFSISSLINPNSAAARSAAHIRSAITDRKRCVLVRAELLRRIFTTQKAERALADKLGLPSDEDLWTHALKMHGLQAAYVPAIDRYRIELLKPKAGKPRKQRTRSPIAKCPQCNCDRYCTVLDTGDVAIEYHTNRSTKERCPGSYTPVPRKGKAA